MNDRLARVLLVLATSQRRTDRGQASSEYLGILVLVAAIITAIFALNIDDTIAGAVSGAVSEIVNAGG